MARYGTGDLYIKRITHDHTDGQRVWQYFDHVLSIVQEQKLNTVARIQSPEGMAAACFDDLLLGAEEDGGF